MMYYIKLGFILLVICAIAAGLLAYINSLTAPVIAERKAQEEISTREALIPGADFEEVANSDGSSYFIARNKENSELMGYTFIAAKTGYSGIIQTMVGLDPDFKVINIRVINQSETPGLGANCTQDSFYAMFRGLGIADLFVDKDGGSVKSLAGATITTRAVTNSIREQVLLMQKSLQSASEVQTAFTNDSGRPE